MTKRTMFATAAAVFAVSTFATAASADVKCGGANACKGQSACKGGQSPAKGANACKGQGFAAMTKEQCAAAKGTFKAG